MGPATGWVEGASGVAHVPAHRLLTWTLTRPPLATHQEGAGLGFLTDPTKGCVLQRVREHDNTHQKKDK